MRFSLHTLNGSLLLLVLVAAAPADAEAAPAPTGLIALQQVASGLSNVVGIGNARDGSGRLFLVLQGGRILIHDGNSLLPTPFLDITSLVSCCGEQGLLGLAFHPNYSSNGFFYVNYTNTSGNTVVARYSVSGDPNVANPSSAVTILAVAQPFANHNGGQLKFGPDGYLYIGLGDGGSSGDPGNRAQNLGELLGKMLRIDVDGGFPYSIPPTNPFVGVTGARPEIWALGLRNPWRYTFDRLTGDLFIADVGQSSREEVNFQPANSQGGQNYGWRRMEGTACFNPSTNCNDGTLVLPILEYAHVGGNCSITGGYRYRGHRFPELYGFYLYGDLCSGRIWGAAPDGSGRWATTELLDTAHSITTFGEDEFGELYVAHYSSTGAIYRIVRTPPSPFLDILTAPGPGPGLEAQVRGFDGSGTLTAAFVAYPSGVDRGANVVPCDVDGDGILDIITGPGPAPGLGAHVKGFRVDGTPIPGLSFLAYPPGVYYGVNVACGDLDGDGRAEIITGPGPGAGLGAHVRAFSYNPFTQQVLDTGVSFLAYPPGVDMGVNVAGGDINGDGRAEILTGPGPGSNLGAHVRAFQVNTAGGLGSWTVTPLPVSFLAYPPGVFYAVNVAAGDLDGDGRADIITGPGPGPGLGAHVRAFRYTPTGIVDTGVSFLAYPVGTVYGVRVGGPGR